MPDISMCANDICPSRLDCYRYRALPSNWQSYMMFDFGEQDRCESFWSINYAPTALSGQQEGDGLGNARFVPPGDGE